MGMDLVLYGTLGLEVLGILICLGAFAKSLKKYKDMKEAYKEYKDNIDELINDYIGDGVFKTSEEVDKEQLMFSMDFMMYCEKKEVKKEIIKMVLGVVVMLMFVLRTLSFM